MQNITSGTFVKFINEEVFVIHDMFSEPNGPFYYVSQNTTYVNVSEQVSYSDGHTFYINIPDE